MLCERERKNVWLDEYRRAILEQKRFALGNITHKTLNNTEYSYHREDIKMPTRITIIDMMYPRYF